MLALTGGGVVYFVDGCGEGEHGDGDANSMEWMIGCDGCIGDSLVFTNREVYRNST